MSNSLANAYRPKYFSDVVGQENIIKILSNQIDEKQIKHGYLFTGSAGTGKTTCARIFARMINEDGKTGEMIEIDAASNNGVDNVREIRENSRYKPINGGFKIYVIDECHMLSTGAWNALLKVLEEPPLHVVFILCTTDPQKIPATILSRVQRFNFRRMITDQIIERLNLIIEEEEYDVAQDAIEYLAKLANGGMRDAISLLDTCISYSEGNSLTASEIYTILGTIEYSFYFTLIDNMLSRDVEKIIYAIEEVHNSGKDLRQFLKGFMEIVLDIEKYNYGGEDYISIPMIYKDDLDRLMSCDLFDNWFDRLVKLHEWIRYDSNPKVLIEGCFIALCKKE